MARKEKYRLEALLRIKEREKRLTELALARALNDLKKARERLDELKEEKEEILKQWGETRDDMSQKMTHGGQVFDGNVYMNYLRKLEDDRDQKNEDIEEQDTAIIRFQELAGRRRRDYIDAAKQHQIMEKHKELWAKKIKKELSREEEKQFDELGSTIHQLRQWRGEGKDERGAMGY